MPTVIPWSPSVDPSELVRQTRDALAAGAVVVLPGDCGYVALWKADVRIELPASALLACGPDEATAMGLVIPPIARRLMFRAWPAPLIVEVPASESGFTRLRYPEHPLFDLVIPAVAELGPVKVADTGTATAAHGLGDAVGLVVDAGERPIHAKPTVVRVSDAGYEIVDPGAFPADEIERLAARIVLFICTGNTCRSPLAEGLAKKLLADRLGCTVSELPARGFWILSAGIAAYGGGTASEESRAVAAEFGVDLSGHASRLVNPQLLFAADDVIVMTQGHILALATRYPGIGPPPRLLCGEVDLDDPIGSGSDVYRECARSILLHLERFLPEWK